MHPTIALQEARKVANRAYADNGKDVNHPCYVSAMAEVKRLCDVVDGLKAKEEFCSVDSGFHRYRTRDGRIMNTASRR